MGIFYVLILLVIMGYCVYQILITKDKAKKVAYAFAIFMLCVITNGTYQYFWVKLPEEERLKEQAAAQKVIDDQNRVADAQKAEKYWIDFAQEKSKNGDFVEAKNSLQGYISKYPDGIYVNDAKNMLASLEPKAIEQEQQAKIKENEEKAANRAANAAKWDEMLESYNTVQSSNNYKILYGGVRLEGSRVVVLVTDYWNTVSKDIKTAYVNQCTSLWYGMCGARKLPVGMSFKFEHNASGRTVATWDSNWGASIK